MQVVTRTGRLSNVLCLDDVDAPTIGDNQVLVVVHAASRNPADLKE